MSRAIKRLESFKNKKRSRVSNIQASQVSHASEAYYVAYRLKGR